MALFSAAVVSSAGRLCRPRPGDRRRTAPPSAGAEPPAPVTYSPPVDAPVVDGFRPPATPYGAGNRGIDYATVPGTPVRAAADGDRGVRRGGRGHLHVDGPPRRRHAHELLVPGRDRVSTETSRRAGGTQSARLGGPAALQRPARRRLPRPRCPAGERSAARPARPRGPARRVSRRRSARACERSSTSRRRREPSAVAATVDWLRRATAVAHAALSPIATDPSAAASAIAPILDWWRRRHHCTPAPVQPEPPPGRRIAVLVGGLGVVERSRPASDALDTDGLGYAPGDVVRFSYAGGRTPDGHGRRRRRGVAVRPRPTALRRSSHAAAGRLVALLDAVAAAAPGARSTSSPTARAACVARAALGLARDPAPEDPTRRHAGRRRHLRPPRTGGADLATVVDAVDESLAGSVAARRDRRRRRRAPRPGLRPRSQQLAPGSPFIGRPGDDGRCQPRLPVVSIGARADLVVPAGPQPAARRDATSSSRSMAGPTHHAGSRPRRRRPGRWPSALAGLPPACE